MNLQEQLSSLVSMDGQLDTNRVSQKAAIYLARNGRHVERFSYQGASYIFKPCTALTVSREQWAQQILVPSIQGVKVPLLLASGGIPHSTDHWIVYEDLGSLNHCDHPDEIIRAAGMIPSWHRIPTSRMSEGAVGHSPNYTQVLATINRNRPYIESMLQVIGIHNQTVSDWWELLLEWEPFIQEHQAISHGDYYRLNIAFQNQQSIVLDWEFTHVNSVYWDLYSLMDITSHRYSLIQLEHHDRVAALQAYWNRELHAIPSELYRRFIKGYSVYASVYSVWILTLIEADIRSGSVADIGALRRQQQETESVLQQCLQALCSNERHSHHQS